MPGVRERERERDWDCMAWTPVFEELARDGERERERAVFCIHVL